MLFITLACAAMVGLTGCGGTGGSKTDSDSIAADTPAFVENQPLESGQYDATAIFQGERVVLTRLLHGSPIMCHSGHLQTFQGV